MGIHLLNCLGVHSLISVWWWVFLPYWICWSKSSYEKNRKTYMQNICPMLHFHVLLPNYQSISSYIYILHTIEVSEVKPQILNCKLTTHNSEWIHPTISWDTLMKEKQMAWCVMGSGFYGKIQTKIIRNDEIMWRHS